LKGIQVLINLTHRGACGCDPDTGDGAGLTIQIPHKFFARECSASGFTLPPAGEYGVAMTFLPVEKQQRMLCEGILERISREALSEVRKAVRGFRSEGLPGRLARGSQPYIEQVFVKRAPNMEQDALERKLYVVRKRVEKFIAASDFKEKDYFYIPSLSSRTVIYKGLLLAPQMTEFYKELLDPELSSALCLVHQRFSTNTFPTWQLAHPFRYIAHNGEINTLKGNVNWIPGIHLVFHSSATTRRCSPSSRRVAAIRNFDNAVELLYQSGRSSRTPWLC
jgi:glutamate synthase domain-containing protein 1